MQCATSMVHGSTCLDPTQPVSIQVHSIPTRLPFSNATLPVFWPVLCASYESFLQYLLPTWRLACFLLPLVIKNIHPGQPPLPTSRPRASHNTRTYSYEYTH